MTRRKKDSDYAVQLREKQKMRRIYGVLEAQFRRYYREAVTRKGVTGAEMLSLLERRLDNVLYRAGMASSRPAARQLVAHAHFNLNGSPINVPSYLVRPGDVITVRDSSRKLEYWKTITAEGDAPAMPGWISADRGTLSANVRALPKREEIQVPIKEQLVVEYYSR
jgi:small subunit ribosomal protein S4